MIIILLLIGLILLFAINRYISEFYSESSTSFQESYLHKYLKEMGYPDSTDRQIDHENGLSYINDVPYRIIFPPSLINTIINIPKIKTVDYCFIGEINEDRDWVNNFKTKSSIIRSTDKSSYDRNNYDISYYKDLCKSKFTLCPIGNCPWSYRFFEAIMCFSIPIMEKNTKDIFCKDYFYYELGDDYAYSFKDALENFCIFLNTNGKNISI